MSKMLCAFTQLFFYILVIVSPARSQTLKSFSIKTDSVNPGDGTSTLRISVYWNTNQYDCSFIPQRQTDTLFTCTADTWQQSTITANKYIPYHVRVEYLQSSAAIQFNLIQMMDSAGNQYNIEEFCIRFVLSITSPSIICSLKSDLINSTRNGMYIQ